MSKKEEKIYKFMQLINKMKLVDRLSLVSKRGRRESDAEHTWHLIMFIWMYSYVYEHSINLLKAIKIGLVHDLVEIQSGDTFGQKRGSSNKKKENEKKAAQKIFEALPPDIHKEMVYLWLEYEQRKTEEAKFVWA